VLTTHPLLAPRSGESRAIPLPPLWAFGPVTGYLYLYQHYWLNHLPSSSSQSFDVSFRQQVVPKLWYPSTKLHDVTAQNCDHVKMKSIFRMRIILTFTHKQNKIDNVRIYNILARSCNHCCSGKATMHYVRVVQLYITLSTIQKYWVWHNNVFENLSPAKRNVRMSSCSVRCCIAIMFVCWRWLTRS
jgi:hypothetical protein